LKTEFLILTPYDESFCHNKEAFVEFLKIDALISVSGQKINYRKSLEGEVILSIGFKVEMDKVQSKQERYFLLVLENPDEKLIDEFSELCERIKTIAKRISPGSTAINTIWDDVGRIYAEKSYPIINEVENLMRKLIAKFMLITVGMDWTKDAIHPDLFKKIENFEDEELYLNDLHKLDFIHLKQVLFEKKRDISLEEIDRLLSKPDFSDDDKEKIRKFVPRSNWEKYFSSLIEDKHTSLETKWELLYKLRNKVAHNRHVTKFEFEKIKGISSQIKDVIEKATAKLGEIDLNEEDRELIIHSYNYDSIAAIALLSEKAVAEFYMKSGFEVTSIKGMRNHAFDFFASKNNQRIAVEVKSVRPESFPEVLRLNLRRLVRDTFQNSGIDSVTKVHLVFVLRDLSESSYPIEKLMSYAKKFTEQVGDSIDIYIGKLNEENAFTSLDEPGIFRS
jgi:DNA-binding transcriptional MerR regulator